MRLALVLPVLLLAAACGGGASATPASDEPATIDSMAKTLGCSPKMIDTDEEGVKEEAECSVDGELVTLVTFADNAARDSYIQVASTLAGGRYTPIKAGAYGVLSDSAQAVLDKKLK